MKLSKTLNILWTHTKTQIQPEFVALLEQSTEELTQSGIADRALTLGKPVSNFTLPDTTNTPVSLQALQAKGPVIISFFHGHWCPYCCLELIAWQEALPIVQEMGATIVAISPQTLAHTRFTVQKHRLSYPVLSDRGNQVARQFGLVYRLQDYLKPVFEAFDHPLPRFNGDQSWELPLPGTFVVDQSGKISYAFVSGNFLKRAEPMAVITTLHRLVAR